MQKLNKMDEFELWFQKWHENLGELTLEQSKF